MHGDPSLNMTSRHCLLAITEDSLLVETLVNKGDLLTFVCLYRQENTMSPLVMVQSFVREHKEERKIKGKGRKRGEGKKNERKKELNTKEETNLL
jgi:hypothetical protein